MNVEEALKLAAKLPGTYETMGERMPVQADALVCLADGLAAAREQLEDARSEADYNWESGERAESRAVRQLAEVRAALAEALELLNAEECRGGHDTSEMLWPGTAHQGVVCRRCRRFLPC